METLVCDSYFQEWYLRLLLDCQHGFVKDRSTVSNLLEYSSFVLKSIEDDCRWIRSTQGSHLGLLCFIWFVNEIAYIFEYIWVLFYADDMKLLKLENSG
jgi:hypothetical protein